RQGNWVIGYGHMLTPDETLTFITPEQAEAFLLDDLNSCDMLLARGTRGADYDFPIIYRFIPAGAGNTVPMRGIWGVLPVYPRW
ncbi:hypothetical protein MJM83_34245, partial [Salmonella enterica subsp. enterica serovar Montevideo]|nr:hypothetical protein [Salmonella enterica subsp. enterica serovar Montevideo]